MEAEFTCVVALNLVLLSLGMIQQVTPNKTMSILKSEIIKGESFGYSSDVLGVTPMH